MGELSVVQEHPQVVLRKRALPIACILALVACGTQGTLPSTNATGSSLAPLASLRSASANGHGQPTDPATPIGNPGFQVGSPGKSTCDPDDKHTGNNGVDEKNHDGRSHHESCSTPTPPPPPPPTPTPGPCGCQW